MIWKFVVQQPRPIAITTNHKNISIHDDSRSRTARIISIMEVCRQTRDECTEMLYATNTFRVYIPLVETGTLDSPDPDYAETFRHFLTTIGPRNRAALRQFHVKVNFTFGHSIKSFRPGYGRHEYFAALSDLTKDLDLAEFKCTIKGRHLGASSQVVIDLLDLARSHSDAIQLLRQQALVPSEGFVSWNVFMRIMAMSTILEELERTAGEVQMLVASSTHQKVDAIRF